MTVLLWFIGNVNCSWYLIDSPWLQTWWPDNVSARLKCFISGHQTPTFCISYHHRWYSPSNTWVAQYPWTKKLTLNWQMRLCNSAQLTQHTSSMKLKMYNLFSLHYGCETWTLYCRHIKKLEMSRMQALRSIFGIMLHDHITNF